MKLGLIASAVTGAFLATSASAVTLDFIGYTDNVSGEFGGDLTVVDATYVPIATSVKAYLGNAATLPANLDDAGAVAYFDGNEAGIGVCADGLSNTLQCLTPSDDNLTSGEVLGLSWGEDVILQSIGFRGELHPNDPSFDNGPTTFDLFDISYDGGASWWTGLQLINQKDGLFGTGGVTISAGTSVLFAFNNEQYYVSSIVLDRVPAVPLPAGGVLLLSGLAGFFALRRRR